MYISIKNRLILLLIAFTILPFILLRTIAYPRIQADLRKVLIQNLEGIGQKQAELVTNWMRERKKNVRVIANNPMIIKLANITKEDKEYKDVIQYLEAVKTEYNYRTVSVSNNQGLITLSTGEGFVGTDISQTDYFKKSIKGDTFASGVIASEIPLINEFGARETGMPTMVISTPLKDTKGFIAGIIIVRVDIHTLSNFMYITLGKTGETYLINKDGMMITESRFAKDLREEGLIKKRCALELKLANPETGELTANAKQCIAGVNGFNAEGYKNYRGHIVLGVWRWLPEFNWGIITEIDKEEGYGVAYNLKYIITFVLLILAFLFVTLAYFAGRKISVPIIRMTEITGKMASGDMSQRVEIKRNDEIGALANSFNIMAESLEKKTGELVMSEKRYRQLLNSLQEGIYQCELTEEGVFIWINQAGAEILGYNSPEEVIGTKVKNIYVNPGDRKRLLEMLTKEKTLKGFSSLCKRKNGENFYMERTLTLITDENGKPLRVDGIFRDITERKLLEKELQESENHYRDLLKSLKEGIYQCEPAEDGVFTWINQAGAEMLGYGSPQEVIGMKVKDMYVNPEDWKDLIEKLEKEGVRREFTSYCKRKSGEQFISEMTCSLERDENGKSFRITGIFRKKINSR